MLQLLKQILLSYANLISSDMASIVALQPTRLVGLAIDS